MYGCHAKLPEVPLLSISAHYLWQCCLNLKGVTLRIENRPVSFGLREWVFAEENHEIQDVSKVGIAKINSFVLFELPAKVIAHKPLFGCHGSALGLVYRRTLVDVAPGGENQHAGRSFQPELPAPVLKLAGNRTRRQLSLTGRVILPAKASGSENSLGAKTSQALEPEGKLERTTVA